ncbi:unnamed protein product [Ceratitis capitata]|uniref:(Mediterranean fruit fly) hypothetical protein n=1 Tax=Ceratitis capitata TaxID=7213 RepID=A0A811U3E9_CERCA|nr:unnamed protein product [Ceratitis capitata]
MFFLISKKKENKILNLLAILATTLQLVGLDAKNSSAPPTTAQQSTTPEKLLLCHCQQMQHNKIKSVDVQEQPNNLQVENLKKKL